ncbi:hypothetical protein [Streptomyces decoyicus]
MAAAVLVALSRRHELVEAYHLIARVRLPELAVAMGCEAMSLMCFAAVQCWLLRAGGVAWNMRLMTAIATAANAVAGALPGGAAFAAAWTFRQLCRRGVEQVLAAAVLVVAGALAALSLFTLLVIGALAAGSTGPDAVVRPAVGVLVLALGTGLMVLGLSRFAGSAAWYGTPGQGRPNGPGGSGKQRRHWPAWSTRPAPCGPDSGRGCGRSHMPYSTGDSTPHAWRVACGR